MDDYFYRRYTLGNHRRMNPYSWSELFSRSFTPSPMEGLFNDLMNSLTEALKTPSSEEAKTPEVTRQTIHRLTFTLAEGDNEAIDRAIALLTNLKSEPASEDGEEVQIEVSETESEEPFDEDFKSDNA